MSGQRPQGQDRYGEWQKRMVLRGHRCTTIGCDQSQRKGRQIKGWPGFIAVLCETVALGVPTGLQYALAFSTPSTSIGT